MCVYDSGVDYKNIKVAEMTRDNVIKNSKTQMNYIIYIHSKPSQNRKSGFIHMKQNVNN